MDSANPSSGDYLDYCRADNPVRLWTPSVALLFVLVIAAVVFPVLRKILLVAALSVPVLLVACACFCGAAACLREVSRARAVCAANARRLIRKRRSPWPLL